MAYSLVPSKPETKTTQVNQLRNGDKFVIEVPFLDGVDYYICDIEVDWPDSKAAPAYLYSHPTRGVSELESVTMVERVIEVKAEAIPVKSRGFFGFLRGKQKV